MPLSSLLELVPFSLPPAGPGSLDGMHGSESQSTLVAIKGETETSWRRDIQAWDDLNKQM